MSICEIWSLNDIPCKNVKTKKLLNQFPNEVSKLLIATLLMQKDYIAWSDTFIFCFTFWMMRGDPKSAPPWSLNPQGCLSDLDSFISKDCDDISLSWWFTNNIWNNLINLISDVTEQLVHTGVVDLLKSRQLTLMRQQQKVGEN